LRRMYTEQENVFYYLTVTNEPYAMPAMPEGARPGILKGLYRFSRSPDRSSPRRAQLLASGALVPEAIRSQGMLAPYGVAADVWSVTSWGELHRDGHACERWNMLHPLAVPRVPYVTQCLGGAPGVIVAVSDYVKALPDSIARWLPGPATVLGTDGFGRSGNRAELRGFFEVDARFMTLAALSALARQGQIGRDVVQQAARDLGIDPERPDPVSS
jgi:pyruvate dehydrogenase E1 component